MDMMEKENTIMTNEDIIKRFTFDLEIGALKPFENINETVVGFRWSKEPDKRKTECKKLLNLLLILEKHLGYKLEDNSYCYNMDGISVSLTNKTCWFFLNYTDYYDDFDVNDLPDYLLEFNVSYLIDDVERVYNKLERTMYG